MRTKNHSHDSLLTTQEAAGILRIKPNTLEHWRRSGRGPACVRLPGVRVVRYRLSDIAKYLSSTAGA